MNWPHNYQTSHTPDQLDDLMRRVRTAREGDDLEDLLRLSTDTSMAVARPLAANEAITREVQMNLFAMGDSTVNWNLAANRSVAGDVQDLLVGEPLCADALASNPAAIHSVQNQLADTLERRRSLASHRSLAPDVQLVLAATDDDYIRLQLAENTALTREASRLLLTHDLPVKVLRALAKNPSLVLGDDLPVFVLRISHHAKTYFRAALAHIPRVTRKEFVPGFEGTLRELVVTCETLGRD